MDTEMTDVHQALEDIKVMIQKLPSDVALGILNIQGRGKDGNINSILIHEHIHSIQRHNINRLRTANERLTADYKRFAHESRLQQSRLRSALSTKDETLAQTEARIRGLMDELDNYKKQGSAPSTTSTNDQTVIQMQNRIRSFMAELDKCKQNESTPGNNNLKDETMAQMSQCILSLMAEVDKHKQKEQSLRDGHEKVSHVTMVSKFLSIRQKIQGISVLPYYNMDKRLSGAITNSDEDNFFSDQYWGSLTTEDRRNRFRAKMFHIMDQCFLIAPTVGLEGYEVKEGDETVDVGLGIHLFEKPLDENKVPPDLITDWRIATMKCIDKLGYQSVLPDLISTSIYTFFQPLLSNWASEAELQAKIQELCQEALDFRLLMRRCKDFYLVKVPGENGVPLSESECDEEYVHPFGVEGGGNQASDEIAYTVFGALVKRPELGGDEERVLEPAWVIMKRA